MANRNQKLSFRPEPTDQFAMWVRAPANTFVAPPTFYQLFLVANDDSYSTGEWIQLRPPFNEPPPTLRTSATTAVPQASSRFEPALGQTNSECLALCLALHEWCVTHTILSWYPALWDFLIPTCSPTSICCKANSKP
jgi:hypothetical protein